MFVAVSCFVEFCFYCVFLCFLAFFAFLVYVFCVLVCALVVRFALVFFVPPPVFLVIYLFIMTIAFAASYQAKIFFRMR